MKKSIVLKIIGMDCASCSAIIEHGLKKEKGVSSANVNFATEKAYLEFDSSMTNVDKVKKTVKGLGYKAEDSDESMDMSVEHDHHKTQKESEVKKLKNRFILSLIFGLPIIYMVMGKMIGLPMPQIIQTYGIAIQAVLSTAVILASFNIWRSGAQKLLKFGPNMDTLILVGTGSAYFYSLAQAVLLFLGRQVGAESFYFESAVFILIFISLGKYLEAVTKRKKI